MNPDVIDTEKLIAENSRLRAGRFTAEEINNICHNLHGTVDARAFAHGCAQEQRKLYGVAPDADEVQKLREALAMVLLFHCGLEWSQHKRAQWFGFTGEKEATTRVMCDEIRMRLYLLPSCFGSYKGSHPSILPKDFQLSEEQHMALDRMKKVGTDRL